MEAALVVTWSTPYPGRERRALEFGASSDEFWGKQAAEGRCSSAEWFFGPDGSGLWMVKGERSVLEEMTASGPGRALMATGQLLLQNWHVVYMNAGAQAEQDMASYATVAEELRLL